MEEIEQLRQEQADRVMPLIGPLLDALDGLPNDTRGSMESDAPALFDCLEAIQKDVEYD